ncbi:MAG: helix-turn-helix domain containing protein [Acetobacteraceae bacterium]|nr:helix-turn-helix domain containing protein [Acetobacteraceae bacterium]
MSSQKSTAAVEPKRQRGRLRVAAIIDAAAAVFAEKGYDAATMTEIAARADTAIGSLYRFFPTKEVLADALLARYVELLMAGLDAIEAAAARLSRPALADAFVDLMLGLQANRAAAVALVDTRSDAADKTSLLRAATRRRIAAILASATGARPTAKAEATAVLLLHLLKFLPMLDREEPADREGLVAELRGLVRLYVSAAAGPGAD